MNTLYGRWIERFPNGNAMEIGVSIPTTIENFVVTKDGRKRALGAPQSVSYGDLGETISIDFKGGGGFIVMFKSRNTLIMDFPGLAARILTRDN